MDCNELIELALESTRLRKNWSDYHHLKINCSHPLLQRLMAKPPPTQDYTPVIEDFNHSAHQSSQDVVSIIAPFIMVLGVIGNILLYFVFPKCTFAARLETRLYIRALAITDIFIMIGLLRKWLHALKNLDFATSSIEACKAINMISYMSTHFAVWLVVAITAERCQAVLWPRKPTANRYRHHVAVLVLLAIFSVLLNIHHVIDTTVVYEVSDDSGTQLYSWEEYHNQKHDPAKTLSYCSMDRNQSDHFAFSLWTVVDGVAYSVVPSMLIIAMNIVIVIRLVRVAQFAKKCANVNRNSITLTGIQFIRSQQNVVRSSQEPCTVRESTNDSRSAAVQNEKLNCALLEEDMSKSRVSEADSDTSNRIVNREREITIMLMTFSVVFVILTAPNCILTAMSNMRFIMGCGQNDSACVEEVNLSFDENSAVSIWIVSLSEMLMYAQHACQFYLYLCGRNFRKLVGYALCTPPPATSFEGNEPVNLSRRQQSTDCDDDLLAHFGLRVSSRRRQNSPMRRSDVGPKPNETRPGNTIRCLNGFYSDEQASKTGPKQTAIAPMTHITIAESDKQLGFQNSDAVQV